MVIHTLDTISIAPAPGRNLWSLMMHLIVLTQSLMVRSVSSMRVLVEARMTIVAILHSSFSLLKMVTFWLAISSTLISSQRPSSSGVGAA